MNQATIAQSKDTAILSSLLLLIVFLKWDIRELLPVSGLILLATLLKPAIFTPIASVWFAFSHFFGRIMSVLILTAIFFLIVTPMGLIRRLLGCDPMQLAPENRNRSSAFSARNHLFVPHDLEKPY